MATKNAFNWAQVCPLLSYGTVYNLSQLCRGATTTMPMGESNSKLSWQKVDGRTPFHDKSNKYACARWYSMWDESCLPCNGWKNTRFYCPIYQGESPLQINVCHKMNMHCYWARGARVSKVTLPWSFSAVHSIPPCVLLDIEGSQDSDNAEISYGFVKCFKSQRPTCYANKTSVPQIPTIPTRRVFTDLSYTVCSILLGIRWVLHAFIWSFICWKHMRWRHTYMSPHVWGVPPIILLECKNNHNTIHEVC